MIDESIDLTDLHQNPQDIATVQELTRKKIFYQLISRTWPIFITIAVLEVQNFTRDTILSHGTHNTSNGYIRPMLLTTLFSGLHSLEVLEYFYSQSITTKQFNQVGAIFRVSCFISLCISVISGTLQGIYGPILDATGVSEEQVNSTSRFFNFFIFSLPATNLLKSQTILYLCDSKVTGQLMLFVTQLITTLIYLLSLYLLLKKHDDIISTALASVVSTWATLFVSTAYLGTNKKFTQYQIFNFRNTSASEYWVLFKKLVSSSFPRYLQFVLVLSSDVVSSYLFGKIGDNELSAYVVSNVYISLLLLPIFAWSDATTIFIARESKHNHIKIGRHALTYGFIYAAFITLTTMFLREQLFYWYDSGLSDAVLQKSRLIFPMVIAQVLPDSIQKIATANYLGSNKTLYPMKINIIGMWCIGVAGSLIFGLTVKSVTLVLTSLLLGYLFSGITISSAWITNTTGNTDNLSQSDCVRLLYRGMMSKLRNNRREATREAGYTEKTALVGTTLISS